jgi:hypothetical protein
VRAVKLCEIEENLNRRKLSPSSTLAASRRQTCFWYLSTGHHTWGDLSERGVTYRQQPASVLVQ